MNRTSYEIQGGDYEQAGKASASLKEQLKRIGADPQAIRRAMIAAYEAEMNVVIHAHRGNLTARMDSGRLEVEVQDEGPGIPDIPRAMTEGFSTAPAAARELGFGAGLGLPNIRRNSDHFDIRSQAGRGTRVSFTIYLSAQSAIAAAVENSLRVAAEACNRCGTCLRACPSGAIRIRSGGPEILSHLCIDCAACIGVCPTGALAADLAGQLPVTRGDTVLLIPASLLFQFGPRVGPLDAMEALGKLGFARVMVLDAWEDALRLAVAGCAQTKAAPTISPVCPAAVNLIATRFPSLLIHLAPFLSPVQAAMEDLRGKAVVFVASCPSQRTAALDGLGDQEVACIAPSALLAEARALAVEAALDGEKNHNPSDTDAAADVSVLRVSGAAHVIHVLEEMENGLLEHSGPLELYLCDQGCFGSPLLPKDPFIALARAGPRAGQWKEIANAPAARAVTRKAAPEARAAMRLDADMGRAIEKLSRIDRLAKTLGGRNCGMCGCPSCLALAEDIVLGRADGLGCKHTANKQE